MNAELKLNIEASQELMQVIQSSELEKTKGEQLAQLFAPFCQKMHEIETKINSINADNPTLLDTKLAREIRLSLAREVRLPAEKVKTKGKEMILIEGRLYDNLYGVINNTSKALEMKCEQIEKFAEIQEAKRKEELRIARFEEIRQYINETDLTFYNLGEMPEESYDKLLENSRLAFEKAIEDAKRAEADRIAREKAEAEERKRIAEENIRLKKEADEREKILAAERLEAQKREKRVLAKAEVERKATARKFKAEQEKQEAKLKLERDEREKVLKELKAQQEAEQKRLEQIEAEKKRKIAEEKKLALAPDKEKILNFAKTIGAIESPKVASYEAQKIIGDADILLSKVMEYLRQKGESL